MTELTESIRAAAITAVTERIAELQCCGRFNDCWLDLPAY